MNRTVELRALEPKDVDLLYDWENNREIWKVSNTLAPFSKYILEKYIENSHLDVYQAKQLRLMIDLKENDEFVRTAGCVDLFDFEPFHLRAGIGILIGKCDDRNQGIASLAIKKIIDYSFDYLHLHQLYCNIAEDNIASIKLFQRAGFEKIGVKKDWLKTASAFKNELMYQLIRSKK